MSAMSNFESDARYVQARLDELHPDEPVPAAYIASLALIVQKLAKYIDDQERDLKRSQITNRFRPPI